MILAATQMTGQYLPSNLISTLCKTCSKCENVFAF